MFLFLSTIDTEAVVIYVFLFLVTLAVFSIIIAECIGFIFKLACQFFIKRGIFDQKSKNYKDERTLQKIAGGLSVFIVAILSHSPYVMGFSLFIGGLIIASERFMRALAIIMKAESKDLPQALGALNSLDSTDASPREIEEKLLEESKEAVPLTPLESVPPPRSSIDRSLEFEKRRRLIEASESAVNTFFANYYGDRYRSQVKISSKQGSVIVDGAIYKRDSEEIDYLVEVKYLGVYNRDQVSGSAPRIMPAIFLLKRTLERIRYYFINKPLIFAIVGNDIETETAEKIGSEIFEKYTDEVWPAVFNLSESGEIKPIYPKGLVESSNTN